MHFEGGLKAGVGFGRDTIGCFGVVLIFFSFLRFFFRDLCFFFLLFSLHILHGGDLSSCSVALLRSVSCTFPFFSPCLASRVRSGCERRHLSTGWLSMHHPAFSFRVCFLSDLPGVLSLVVGSLITFPCIFFLGITLE